MTKAHLKVAHAPITNEIRIAISKRKRDTSGTQKDIAQWVAEKFGMTVSQAAISKILKQQEHCISQGEKVGARDGAKISMDAKRQKTVEYPLMEEALYKFVRTYEDVMDLSGELYKEKGRIFLERLYPDQDTNTFQFSNGWLNRFKARYGIKERVRHEESGSVNLEILEQSLPAIREVLDQYEWKDIYNMDETGLFYRLQVCRGQLKSLWKQLQILKFIASSL